MLEYRPTDLLQNLSERDAGTASYQAVPKGTLLQNGNRAVGRVRLSAPKTMAINERNKTMTVNKEPIACSFGPPEQATGLSHLTDELYPQTKSLSSLKIIIGGLLLFGDNSKKVFWPFFDAMLRQYVNLRLASQSESEPSGATILHQPE